MTLLGALVAQLLHIALIAAAAPTLGGVRRWLEARIAGRVGPPLLQPWQELGRLLRQPAVLTEGASRVSVEAPVVCAAATAVAASLVPSFTLGMAFARFADLLAIAGLLALARISLALGAMDTGTATGGVAASRTLLLAAIAEPALLLVLFALALFAGSLDLDLIAAMQLENGGAWPSGVIVALAATLLVVFVDATRREAWALGLSGRDLALSEATEALRLLVWFDLIGAMFLPFGMAPSGAGPVAWFIGIVAWLARTLIAVLLLTLSRTMVGRLGLPLAARTLGVAVLFGALAAVFLLADIEAT
jgi:formate hydrogenlyase subunit 4